MASWLYRPSITVSIIFTPKVSRFWRARDSVRAKKAQ